MYEVGNKMYKMKFILLEIDVVYFIHLYPNFRFEAEIVNLYN